MREGTIKPSGFGLRVSDDGQLEPIPEQQDALRQGARAPGAEKRRWLAPKVGRPPKHGSLRTVADVESKLFQTLVDELNAGAVRCGVPAGAPGWVMVT